MKRTHQGEIITDRTAEKFLAEYPHQDLTETDEQAATHFYCDYCRDLIPMSERRTHPTGEHDRFDQGV